MNKDMYTVVVDTRGMLASSIDGYEEHTCTEEYFDEHVLSHPKVVCTKSKVAELCGFDMKIYFNEYARHQHMHKLTAPPTVGITEEEKEFYPTNIINKGASLLTFDPRTGYCEYRILGKAYVVVDSGDYPLSNRQVWGLQDLISEARDVYHCDPEHMYRGHEQLLQFCKDYRKQNYGPLTIYEPREVVFTYKADEDYSDNLSMKVAYDPDDHVHHHHGKHGRVRLADYDAENDRSRSNNRKSNHNMFARCHALD